MTEASLAAALSGVPAGVQAQGVWAGRRQLFVRFAGEAETATMYTTGALVREIERQLSRTVIHSLCIGGRDPLANLAFLLSALSATTLTIPVMLDTDGQRPDALAALAPRLALAQVTVDFVGPDTTMAKALETLSVARKVNCADALVLCPRDDTSDALVLRAIEKAHGISPNAQLVIHPPTPGGEHTALDRRWATLLDQATAVHADTRLAMRIPPPTGLR